MRLGAATAESWQQRAGVQQVFGGGLGLFFLLFGKASGLETSAVPPALPTELGDLS